MASKKPRGGDGDLDLLDRNEDKEKLKPPSKYKIIYHNDDKTPMQLVTMSLMDIYGYDGRTAQMLMIRVHEGGRAVVKDNLSKEIGETKLAKTKKFFHAFGYDLNCTLEEQ